MKYKVIGRKKLIELIPTDHIISIIVVRSHYGSSLAIGIKDAYPTICRKYGGSCEGDSTINTVFFPLDRYSYSAPSYVAIPKEQYKNIVIMKKRALFDSEQEWNESAVADEFIKATITKKIVW